ncbi:MAG: hypothetical protein NTV56_01485 [Alphaproteobacteria bacterium]|nr:hypothetical protein [Alphaproteobacteria bacterium]
MSRCYRLSDRTELHEQQHAGNKTDQTASRPDVEKRTHGDAAITVRPRERDYKRGKPRPTGEHAKNTGKETDDEAHGEDNTSQPGD